MSAVDVYCRNAQGQIVLQGVIWKRPVGLSPEYWALSLYAFTGIRTKRRTNPVLREFVEREAYTDATMLTMLHNYAHLWAMQNGVSDFEFRVGNFDIHKYLFHPSQLKEIQT